MLRGEHSGNSIERQSERVVVERLLKKRLRARLHRLHNALERAYARHHDHGDGFRIHLELVQQVDARHVRELHVEERDIRRELAEGNDALFSGVG